VPFFHTFAAARGRSVLRIVNSLSVKRRLRAIPKGICFSDGLLKSLWDFRQQHSPSLPLSMLNCFVVNLCMPEVVSDEFRSHAFECECHVGVIALVDALPVNKGDST